jgi:hypothetical protein
VAREDPKSGKSRQRAQRHERRTEPPARVPGKGTGNQETGARGERRARADEETDLGRAEAVFSHFSTSERISSKNPTGTPEVGSGRRAGSEPMF